ncbi:MAG: protein kinase [Planctomycetota bacterium]|nr:protein kinase [Planctomycetota bacterium]
MSAERHKRLRALFEAARNMPEQDRRRWLDAICADDPTLADDVLALIEEATAGGRARTQAAGMASAADPDETLFSGRGTPRARQQEEQPRERIGRYVLKQKLGDGGMGVVYLAQRDSEAGGKGGLVALKLMRSTVGGEEDRKRFLREHRLLSALEHPNIARLLDAGTTDEGHPYFVMEYVRGVSIDRYCDENRLTMEERLGLFRKVCDAVHYVHQNLIIHRDLKPGNILVTAEGEPKLLDFGISKLANPALDPGIEVTSPGFRLLTPRYASPEQIRNLPLTTATDVYSLGVLLYELLTGHWPYAIKTTEIRAIERAICDLEPEKPSTAVARTEGMSPDGKTGPMDPTVVARARGAMPSKIRSRLRGDLDNVLLKSLDKSPRRRYQSVAEMAEDLRRHLSNETVRARPPSVRYRVSKFVRRNRGAVIAGVLLVLSLAGGAAAASYQWRRAETALATARASEEAARLAAANAEAARARVAAIAGAMVGDIQSKIVKLAGSTPARQDLANIAIENLESLLAASPHDSSLKLELARALNERGQAQADRRSASAGNPEAALQDHQRALQIRRDELARDPANREIQAEVATSVLRIADIYRMLGRASEASAHYREAIDRLEELLRSGNTRGVRAPLAAALAARGELAINAGQVDEAVAAFVRAQEIRRVELAEAPSPRARRNLSVGHLDLARAYELMGDRASAGDALDQAVALRRELAASDEQSAEARRDLSRALLEAAGFHLRTGGAAQALPLAREADAVLTKLLADEREGAAQGQDAADPRSREAWITAQLSIASALGPAGDQEEARRRLERALEEARRLVTGAPSWIAGRRALTRVLAELGEVESRAGRHELAAELLAEANDEITRIESLAEPDAIDVKLREMVRAGRERVRERSSGGAAPPN